MKNVPIQSIYDVKELIDEDALDARDREHLEVSISEAFIEQSEGVKWLHNGDLDWGLDLASERVFVKGTGSMEDYALGRMARELKNHEFINVMRWIKEYGGNVKTAVICYGISSIGQTAFRTCTCLASIHITEGVK